MALTRNVETAGVKPPNNAVARLKDSEKPATPTSAGMPPRQGRHHGAGVAAEEQREAEQYRPASTGIGLEHHSEIELARVELGTQMSGQYFHQVQLDVRIADLQGLDQGEGENACHRRRQPHADIAPKSVTLGRLHGVVGLTQGELSVVQEGRTRGRGRDAQRCTVEQADTEFLLQPGERLTQRRGAHAKLQGGASEALPLDDLREVAQLT